MHIFLAKDDQWAPYLHREVQQQISEKAELNKRLALVQLDDAVDIKDQHIAFALATLPHCQIISQETIGQQVKQVIECIKDDLNPNEAQIKLQVFSLTQKYGITTSGRAKIISDQIKKFLKKTSWKIKTGRAEPHDSLVQIMIWPDRSLRLSLLNSQAVQEHFYLLGPFPGGHIQIPDDLKAPSRAFKKLLESQKILGCPIKEGEKVLDLGASPGGWSYIALMNGAQVTAIDRSPLCDELMNNSNVEFIKGDAFNFDDQKDYDWVISDIICDPQRVLELIEKWVIADKKVNFIFTLKFKGDENYHILGDIKKALSHYKGPLFIRQLNSNKNEVTVMGLVSKEA